MKLPIITLIASMAAGLTASAQQQWTYADCMAYAREHNIQLRQSALQGEDATLALDAARAQWTPSLGFSTSHSVTNTPWGNQSPATAYNSSYGLNASWTVWDGNQRSNDIRRAELNTRYTALGTEAIESTLETEILSLYINILYAAEAISVSRENATSSRAVADRAKLLFESGRYSRPDYAQLEAQAQQDEYAVVSAQAQYDTQRIQLKKLLELPIEADLQIAPVEFTQEQVLSPLPSITESYPMALSVDEQLKQCRVSEQMADVDVKIARAGYYPSIALSAGVGSGYYSAMNDGWGTQMKQGFNENVGLTLSVPIWDQKKTKTAVSRANVTRLNAELDRQSRENELARQLEGWYVDHSSATERYRAGLQQLEAATVSNELVTAKFELGSANPTELIQSHSTLSQARHELLQAKYMAILAAKMVEEMRTNSVVLN